jgi:hypothetical protein
MISPAVRAYVKAAYSHKIDSSDGRGSLIPGSVGMCINNCPIRLDGMLELVVGFISPRPAQRFGQYASRFPYEIIHGRSFTGAHINVLNIKILTYVPYIHSGSWTRISLKWGALRGTRRKKKIQTWKLHSECTVLLHFMMHNFAKFIEVPPIIIPVGRLSYS